MISSNSNSMVIYRYPNLSVASILNIDGIFSWALPDLQSNAYLCSTDTDTCIGIGRIRIRGYVKFLQKLKAQRCIGVSDTDTRIRFTIF